MRCTLLLALAPLVTSCAARCPSAASPSTASEPTDRPSSCNGGSRQLDFWLGDWDLVVRARKTPTSDEWETARGTNHVTAVLGGCGVEESFRADGPGKPWAGKSLSLFVEAEHQWRQTWIDDSGEYLAFRGGLEKDDMILRGEPQVKDGVTRQMRMVFTGISHPAFVWRWERSLDGGASWTPVMIIDYARHRG